MGLPDPALSGQLASFLSRRASFGQGQNLEVTGLRGAVLPRLALTGRSGKPQAQHRVTHRLRQGGVEIRLRRIGLALLTLPTSRVLQDQQIVGLQGQGGLKTGRRRGRMVQAPLDHAPQAVRFGVLGLGLQGLIHLFQSHRILICLKIMHRQSQMQVSPVLGLGQAQRQRDSARCQPQRQSQHQQATAGAHQPTEQWHGHPLNPEPDGAGCCFGAARPCGPGRGCGLSHRRPTDRRPRRCRRPGFCEPW